MKKYIINNERALLEILNYQLQNGNIEGVSFDVYNKFIHLLKYNINNNTMYEEKTAIYESKSFDEIFLDTKKYLVDNDICPDIYFENSNIKVGYGLTDMTENIYSLFGGYMEKIVHSTLKEVVSISHEYSSGLFNFDNNGATISSIIVDNIIDNYINSQVRLGNWPNHCTDIDEYVLQRNIGPFIDRKLSRSVYYDLCINTLKCVNQKLKENENVLFFSNDSLNLRAFANYIALFNPIEFEFLKKYIYNSDSVGDKKIDIGVSNDRIMLLETTLMYYDYFGNKKYEIKQSYVDKSRGDKIRKLVHTI